MFSEIRYPLILLAGGASKRMGQPKALIKVRGLTWLEMQLIELAKLNFKHIAVVLGYSSQEIQEQTRLQQKEVRVVVNPHPERGQFSSLQCGLYEQTSEFIFLLPIDVPVPEKDVWCGLQEQSGIGVHVIQPEYNKKLGHPILLSMKFAKEILKRKPDDRLDFLIHQKTAFERKLIEVHDKRVLMNLNTPSELDDYLKYTL